MRRFKNYLLFYLAMLCLPFISLYAMVDLIPRKSMENLSSFWDITIFLVFVALPPMTGPIPFLWRVITEGCLISAVVVVVFLVALRRILRIEDRTLRRTLLFFLHASGPVFIYMKYP